MRLTKMLCYTFSILSYANASMNGVLFLVQYLAWSLKRSKAVNNSKRVVGVIGKGHMKGVIYALLCDTGNLRFRDLVGKDSSGDWISGLVKSLVRDTIIGIFLWALYEFINGGT